MTEDLFKGSAECSKNVEDCSEGEKTGRAFGGSTTFQAGGMVKKTFEDKL